MLGHTMSVGVLVVALVMAACSVAASAAAHDLPPASPVTLQLHVTRPGSVATVEALQPDTNEVESLRLRCQNLCSVQLPRGRYRLSLYPQGGSPAQSQEFRLTAPVRFTSSGADPQLRVLGVSLIVVGGVAALSGLGAISYAALSQICEDYHCGASPAFFWYGAIATPLGAAVTVVGVLLFMHNRRAFVREKLASDQGSVHVAFTSTPGGVGVAATF